MTSHLTYTRITAHTVFSEIGFDIDKFPTVNHFASWLGLSPNNKITGGKVLSARTRKSSNPVAKALRMSAQALANSKSYLGHFYRRMRAKFGAPKANTATAHKLARIVYTMLINKSSYDESVFERHDKILQERRKNSIIRQAKLLGMEIIIP